MNLKILFEDTHVIVCYKPAGVPTQTSKIGSQDMVSILKNYLYKNQKEKKEPYVAVIHRLDQPVEGILVFGKTPFAAKELSAQMQGAGFGKYYQAVVCGKFEEKSGKLEHYMVKDGRVNLSKVCDPSIKDAKYNEKQSNGRRKIALCASHLEFLHPKTKEKMIFEIEPEGEGFRKIFF